MIKTLGHDAATRGMLEPADVHASRRFFNRPIFFEDTVPSALAPAEEAPPRVSLDHDLKLRQLLDVAKQTQHAVMDAVTELGNERAALARERASAAKAKAKHDVVDASAGHRPADAQAAPGVEAAVEKAVKSSMARVLGFASTTGEPAWGTKATPVLVRFSSVTEMANVVADRIKEAANRHVWQWAALYLLCMAATGAVAMVAVQEIRAQQQDVLRAQSDLKDQKAAFAEEMARMQANVTYLAKEGGRIRLEQCGPQQRLCIEVSPDQGKGSNDFRGRWSDGTDQRTFVIPKGY